MCGAVHPLKPPMSPPWPPFSVELTDHPTAGDTEVNVAKSSELAGGNIRASDRDRAKVTAELRTHCVEGRIAIDELELRIARAMSSHTIHDLAEIVADLPTVSVPDVPLDRGPVRVGPPGSRAFTQRLVVPATVPRTRALVLDTIAPGLNACGYELKVQSGTELQFERSARSGGLLGMLTPPKIERIVISLESTHLGETTMIIYGRAPRSIRKKLATLTFR